MKKKFTFYDLIIQKRLFAVWLLLFLLLLSNKNFAQTFCRPTANTTSIGGVCLGPTGVTNAALAYDSSLSTYATITNSLGVACFAQETVTFNQTAKAGDEIVLYYGNGSAVISAGVLANSTLQPLLSGSPAGDAVPLSGLVNLQLLDNGDNINVVKYTLTSDANQIKIQTGGLVSLLINLRIYDVRLQFAKPTIANGETQSVCFGQSVALSATAATGTTVAWYDSPTATTPLSSVGTYTTPALTATTTYYVSTSRNAGCESDQRLPVTINVIQPIVPVISTTGTTICSAGATQATTLSVINPVLGTTYNWYDAATGGTLLATGSTYTPTVPLGTSTFYVEASIGTCKSTRTPVTVTSTSVPALATVLTQSVSILSGQNATLSASTTEPGVGLDWYDVPTGGTKLLANSNTFTTPILTATKTYYVESVNLTGGCVSATRVPVTVTVQPTASGGCLEASSQVTTQIGICLLCNATNPNFSVDGNPATAARLTIPANVVGSMQQTLQFTNPGKAGDNVDVDLELPGGLADVQLLSAISLATYNGATYNNDRVTINNPLITLQLLSGTKYRASVKAGANFDRVEVRLGGVLGLLTNLDIYQATYRYKAPTVSGNTTICSGQTATLNASLALGETIKWYDASTGGNLLASTASFTTPALTANTTYYVELTRNGCVNSERNPVAVTVNNPVAPTSISTVPTNLCSGETTTITIQSPVAGTTYNWYDAATGGTLVFTGTSFVTPSLTVPTIYHIEAVIGTCLSARTPVNVNVNPRPAPPVPVSANVIIQSGQNVQLSVVSSPGVSYLWYDAPTGGNLLQGTGSNIYTPNPVLTANKTFYVEAVSTASDCKSTSRTAINVMVTNTVSTCLQPSSQTTSIDPGLLCALCTFSNPGDSVDNDIDTFATLSTVAGVAGSYVQQILTFPSEGKVGDIIEVELALPGGLADVSLLGGVSLATYGEVFGAPVFNNDRVLLNNGLISLQLLSGDRFKASFVATAPFNQVEIRLGGVVTLLTNLNIYGASYRFPNATITGAAAPICAGQAATLTATSTGTETFTWYDAPTGGNIVAVSPTLPLTATTIYYLEATRGGTCINSVRQPVTVNVLSIPTDADISIASPLTASCAGGIVLAPTSALTGATFRYYRDQNKGQEITTGTVAGITYVKDPTTGALTISGLTSASPTYTYYVSVSNGGLCENVNGTLKEVVVNYPAGSNLTVTSPFAGCTKVNLKDAITNFDANVTYTFFDSANNPITDQAAANITVSGNYFIQAQQTGVACPSVKVPVTVNVTPLPTLTGVTNSIAVTKGSSVTLTATSNGTITWYDPQGNALGSNSTGPLNTVGVFTYTVVASNGSCTTSQTVTISVIDPATCDTLLERVYANSQLSGSVITGNVTNGALAVDADPSTFSTITTGLGVLGVGTTWQNLQWPTTIPKGTPVTVKLGLENSLIAVGQSVTVIGTKRDGSNNPIDIGNLQSVSSSLLNLLPGQNSFEYTFVPSNASGVQDYDGIRVQLGAVLGVAQNINVYDAYYKKQVSQIACGQGDIEDIFSGVKDMGVGALTATVGVSNPWNVADGDVATYATMFSGAGVLAAAELTTKFRTPSMVGDSLRITISKPGTLLNLNLLTGFRIQLYSGNIAVGAPIENTSSLLTLKLLSGDTMAMTIVAPQTQPYDKVVITFGGVASVLDQLRVHTIDRVTNTKVIGSGLDNKLTVCPGDNITLQVPPKSCADYAWYDSPTGGNLVASGQTYTIPVALPAGTYKYYVQPIRYGCAALERGEVTVVVRATTPVSAVANVTINGGNSTIICSETGTVTLDAILSNTPVLTNPVYRWYSFDGTTSQLIAGETTSKLVINGLAPGTYTYYLGVSSDEYCETIPANRKQVTFTILPTSLESDIVVNNASICHNTDAVLTPSSTLPTPVFFWYLDANKTQPILNGTVSGVTYAVDSTTGVLTVSGLTPAMSPLTYYVAVTSDNTCQNKNGELKAATVIVNDPPTPTSTENTQNFCLINAPTVANLQANEANVVWYLSDMGGTALDPTTALVDGTIYYGAIKDLLGCESSVRSEITVHVNDPGTPTLVTPGVQNFCKEDLPTFASIQFNQANIVWYTALTGGTLIPSTTALTTGQYFAAISDLLTGCESATRLPVDVNVNDPGTPTLVTAGVQTFCKEDLPTFASIQTNEANIVWYTATTGGTLIPSTTALTTGQYFAAISDPATGCESAARLTVDVIVNDPGTPTLVTAGTQNFCLANAPTFASIQTNEANIVWYTAITGGTLILPTTALTTGQYFAAISDPATGCESASRLTVDVIVNDPGTPTLVTAGVQNFCKEDLPTFASIQFNQANIVWYTTLTGGTLIPSTTALTTGQYFAAISDLLTGCESATRLPVDVNVNDPGTPTLVTAGVQTFCKEDLPTFASIQTNEANIVWYTAITGGTLIPSTTALTTGQYFAAISDPATGCESAARLTVDVIVNDPGTPTLVTAGTQNFCLANAPTFASIQTNEANIVWYTALTGGAVIAPTTALTTGQYFAVISDPATGCESASRLTVDVIVSDPGTPTLVTAGTQNFCLVNAPTFANIQFNQANIVWYTALTGGTVIPLTTALATGQYFVAISDPLTGCESATRLPVDVNVTDPATPTTNSTTQNFCSGTNPTVANLQVNESNVVWFTTQTGGTALAATDVLTTTTYFGAIKDPATGCESSVRLQVAVTVGNPANPTTNNTAQTFCSVNAPTIANMQVNESNVTWFTTATGGTAIPAGTALASGIYFGSIVDGIGCESSTRLQVTVTVVNPSATPTTANTTQNFCTLNSPTVANIQVNEANVIWYSTATGGTAIPPTTALVTGTYYGAVSSTIGCENPARLAVVVNVNSPSVITTPRTTQTFCLSAVPTLANILVNETNVVWYASATGGTPLANTTPLTATTYYAGALTNTFNGCDNGPRLGITIAFENDAAVQIASTDDTPCVFKGVTYSIANGKSNYVWTINGGTIVSGGGTNDGSVTVSWSDIGPGTVTVAYVNNCDERTIKTLNVTVASCSDLTITHTVDNPTPNFGDQVTFTITVNNVGEGDFINTLVSDLLPSGLQLVSSSATSGTYDPATQLWTIPTLNAGQSVVLTIVAEVLPNGTYTSVATVETSTPLDVDASNNSASVTLEPICLTVYNEFTPNNDGKNDLFRIDCIESYPNNELKVFNRYGALVYSKAHYENDWNGTANVSGVINRGDMLPTGTYFYVITIGDGTVKKGWLSIMR